MASKKLYCVFSTLTCDNKYASHKPTDNGMVVKKRPSSSRAARAS
jgi:hypothetical protein